MIAANTGQLQVRGQDPGYSGCAAGNEIPQRFIFQVRDEPNMLGIAVLGVIQDMPAGNQAGLESIIFGKTASMIRSSSSPEHPAKDNA